MWIMGTIHPRISNSLIPKLLRGADIVQESTESCLLPYRNQYSVGETQPAGRDLAAGVPGPHSPSLQSTARAPHWQTGQTQ